MPVDELLTGLAAAGLDVADGHHLHVGLRKDAPRSYVARGPMPMTPSVSRSRAPPGPRSARARHEPGKRRRQAPAASEPCNHARRVQVLECSAIFLVLPLKAGQYGGC